MPDADLVKLLGSKSAAVAFATESATNRSMLLEALGNSALPEHLRSVAGQAYALNASPTEAIRVLKEVSGREWPLVEAALAERADTHRSIATALAKAMTASHLIADVRVAAVRALKHAARKTQVESLLTSLILNRKRAVELREAAFETLAHGNPAAAKSLFEAPRAANRVAALEATASSLGVPFVADAVWRARSDRRSASARTLAEAIIANANAEGIRIDPAERYPIESDGRPTAHKWQDLCYAAFDHRATMEFEYPIRYTMVPGVGMFLATGEKVAGPDFRIDDRRTHLTRTVSIYGFTERRGQLYVRGLDGVTEEFRTFRVSRIRKARLLEETYEIPDWFLAGPESQALYEEQQSQTREARERDWVQSLRDSLPEDPVPSQDPVKAPPPSPARGGCAVLPVLAAVAVVAVTAVRYFA